MTFETFDKAMLLIQSWRSRHGYEDWVWPDSREPDLWEILKEFGLTAQELEKSMVALAAWRMAEEDVYQILSAITHVIRNRGLLGLHRSHLSVDHRDQFRYMTDHMSVTVQAKERKYPKSVDNFQKLLENLDQILENKVVDLTQGATYFGVVGAEMSEWFKKIATSPEYERTTLIGRYTFYRPVKK